MLSAAVGLVHPGVDALERDVALGESIADQVKAPAPSYVGNGMCTPNGILVYKGNGDNSGSTQDKIDNCAAACFNQKTSLGYGSWSSRGAAVGFSVKSTGTCYCNHEDWASCTKGYGYMKSYKLPAKKYVVNSKCKASVAETWTVSSSGDSITRPDGSSYTVDLVDLGQGYYAAQRTSDGKCLIVGGNCHDSFFHWFKWTSDGSTCGLENYKGKGFMLSNGQAALKLTQV
jgi:hypothetical protein